MFAAPQSDVDRCRAVVEPGTLTQIRAAAVEASRIPFDLPGLVNPTKRFAIFVAVVPSMLRPSESNGERRRAVVEPGAGTQSSTAVETFGAPDDLPRLAQSAN